MCILLAQQIDPRLVSSAVLLLAINPWYIEPMPEDWESTYPKSFNHFLDGEDSLSTQNDDVGLPVMLCEPATSGLTDRPFH
ncbi:MAG: hypothetical protein HYZ68_04325 [Chloroflexi bacterium]|nr:hypothetical protein [Chloroflexota bacterium]